jgi:hypothetical protein
MWIRRNESPFLHAFRQRFRKESLPKTLTKAITALCREKKLLRLKAPIMYGLLVPCQQYDDNVLVCWEGEASVLISTTIVMFHGVMYEGRDTIIECLVALCE